MRVGDGSLPCPGSAVWVAAVPAGGWQEGEWEGEGWEWRAVAESGGAEEEEGGGREQLVETIWLSEA